MVIRQVVYAHGLVNCSLLYAYTDIVACLVRQLAHKFDAHQLYLVYLYAICTKLIHGRIQRVCLCRAEVVIYILHEVFVHNVVEVIVDIELGA